MLQLDIKTQGEVASGNRFYIVCSALVTSLNAAAGVAYQDFCAFDAPQVWLVGALYAKVAGVVAGRVIGITLDVGLRNFAQVAKQIGSGAVIILPEDAFLNIEPREAV